MADDLSELVRDPSPAHPHDLGLPKRQAFIADEIERQGKLTLELKEQLLATIGGAGRAGSGA